MIIQIFLIWTKMYLSSFLNKIPRASKSNPKECTNLKSLINIGKQSLNNSRLRIMYYFNRIMKCCWLRSRKMILGSLRVLVVNRRWLWSRIREVIYRIRLKLISLFRNFRILFNSWIVIVLIVLSSSLFSLSFRIQSRISLNRIY